MLYQDTLTILYWWVVENLIWDFTYWSPHFDPSRFTFTNMGLPDFAQWNTMTLPMKWIICISIWPMCPFKNMVWLILSLIILSWNSRTQLANLQTSSNDSILYFYFITVILFYIQFIKLYQYHVLDRIV